MRKVLLLLAGAAVLCAPAVSVAGDSFARPAELAARQKGFRGESVSNLARMCRRRRNELTFGADHDNRTLDVSHGDRAAANTLGKCVSAIARRKPETGDKDSANQPEPDRSKNPAGDKSGRHHPSNPNPAWACKAMEANDLSHFQATYGTRPNAFGKCVSGKAEGKKAGR